MHQITKHEVAVKETSSLMRIQLKRGRKNREVAFEREVMCVRKSLFTQKGILKRIFLFGYNSFTGE